MVKQSIFMRVAMVLVFAIATGSALAEKTVEQKAGTTLTEQDQTFITDAGQAGMAEVEFAKLALRKSDDADTKKMSQQLVTDHTKANRELATLAKKLNTSVPSSISDDQKATKTRLENIEDKDSFEVAYADVIVKGHEKSVALFESESKNGDNAELKTWASQTLPTLKKHYDMAVAHQKMLKAKTGTTGTGGDMK